MDNIKFRFIDPLNQAEELIKQGLQPSRLSVQEDGKVSEAVIFPWATIEYKDKKRKCILISKSICQFARRTITRFYSEFRICFRRCFS